MPIYDYECKQCGHVTEKLQFKVSKITIECPKCDGKAKRIIGTGIKAVFKGSGFYETDYKARGK
jgi:putative FmdB family regulatory protein